MYVCMDGRYSFLPGAACPMWEPGSIPILVLGVRVVKQELETPGG